MPSAAATLESNFIYWMTGAYIPVGSDEVRARITDNLREEVRDCHPWMMRRLASPALLAHSELETEMSEDIALLPILIQNIVVNN